MPECCTKIAPEQDKERVDKIFAEILHPTVSRSELQKYAQFEYLTGPNKWNAAPGKTRVHPGQQWRCHYEINGQDTDRIVPWDFPLEILHETDDFVVINKPVGISVHPSSSAPEPQTIVNALVAHYGGNFAENFEASQAIRPGIVHRLDKETSGALLVAKNSQSLRFFQENWRNVTKKYLAITQGQIMERGKISGKIYRDPDDRTKMTISNHPQAKEAISAFERCGSSAKHSGVCIEIFTGRTHQIRVHLAHLGHPVIGDTKYGQIAASRMMLHAKQLQFQDPKTNERVTIAAPTPPEFLTYFDASQWPL